MIALICTYTLSCTLKSVQLVYYTSMKMITKCNKIIFWIRSNMLRSELVLRVFFIMFQSHQSEQLRQKHQSTLLLGIA